MSLFTAKQVASAWQLPLARVYELARLGILPCVKTGARQVRFDEAALREFVVRGGVTASLGTDRRPERRLSDAA